MSESTTEKLEAARGKVRAARRSVATGDLEFALTLLDQLDEDLKPGRPFSAARLRDEPELLFPVRRCECCNETPVAPAVTLCKPCLDEAEQEMRILGY